MKLHGNLTFNSISAKFPLSGELCALLALGAIVHALVLLFIFPGFYDPFWPLHSDFYVPAGFAKSKDSLFSIVLMPRPMGMAYFLLTGYLGIRGAIVANFAVLLLNTIVCAIVMRRIIGLTLAPNYFIGYVLFAFLVFSHPYQYVWATYDVFSQLSFLFLSCAVLIRLNGFGLLFQLILVSFAFLVKETYALSFLALVGCWWLFSQSQARRSITKLGLVVSVIIAFALLLNRYLKSPFLGVGSHSESPYATDFSVNSIFSEWLRYSFDGIPTGTWLLVLLAAWLLFVINKNRNDPILKFAIILPILGILSWLPNSALPNHHYNGYSFNGSYLIYLPFLLVCISAPLKTSYKAFVLVLVTLAFLSPFLASARYKSNSWTISQQLIQKNILRSIESALRETAQESRYILVTGLDSPFSPFDAPDSLGFLGFDHARTIHVISYQKGKNGAVTSCSRLAAGSGLTKLIEPDVATCRKYDVVWIFQSDGTISSVLKSDSADDVTKKQTANELMIFPAVAKALGVSPSTEMSILPDGDGYKLLGCGKAFLDYGRPKEALRCLEESARKIPENSYVYFFSGLASEQIGRSDEAVKFFEKAVAYDDKKNSNSGFADALRRSKKAIRPQ
jgi:tetratricopeptide (TPR) repeat protein